MPRSFRALTRSYPNHYRIVPHAVTVECQFLHDQHRLAGVQFSHHRLRSRVRDTQASHGSGRRDHFYLAVCLSSGIDRSTNCSGVSGKPRWLSIHRITLRGRIGRVPCAWKGNLIQITWLMEACSRDSGREFCGRPAQADSKAAARAVRTGVFKRRT